MVALFKANSFGARFYIFLIVGRTKQYKSASLWRLENNDVFCLEAY
jgi:hypothetical protein